MPRTPRSCPYYLDLLSGAPVDQAPRPLRTKFSLSLGAHRIHNQLPCEQTSDRCFGLFMLNSLVSKLTLVLALGVMSRGSGHRCTHMHVWVCFCRKHVHLLSRAKDVTIKHWSHSLMGSHYEQKRREGNRGEGRGKKLLSINT